MGAIALSNNQHYQQQTAPPRSGSHTPTRWGQLRLKSNSAPSSKTTDTTATTDAPSPDSPPKSAICAPPSKPSPTVSANKKNASAASKPDNTLAESVNSLYKAELIYGPDQGRWRTVEEIELATLMWLKWYNEQRIHGYLNNVPPTEYEDAYHAERSGNQLLGNL